MLLPSKEIRFEESILPVMRVILSELKNGPLSPNDLFERTKGAAKNLPNFSDALTALFALKKIALDEEKGVLSYVDGNLF
jgi:hypothetical protein